LLPYLSLQPPFELLILSVIDPELLKLLDVLLQFLDHVRVVLEAVRALSALQQLVALVNRELAAGSIFELEGVVLPGELHLGLRLLNHIVQIIARSWLLRTIHDVQLLLSLLQ
jgi:hypothetical protein